MNQPIKLSDKDKIKRLKAGDEVLFSGEFYTGRDQAHKKIVELIKKNNKLPLDLEGEIIYYTGPTPPRQGRVIGSCGPTTSARMDLFVEPLLEKGLLAMVGKGPRSKQVKELIKKYKAVYFLAPAGCGALLSEKVKAKKIVCFKNFGPEAVYRLKVERFPLIVGIDSKGRSVYT